MNVSHRKHSQVGGPNEGVIVAESVVRVGVWEIEDGVFVDQNESGMDLKLKKAQIGLYFLLSENIFIKNWIFLRLKAFSLK